MPDDWLPPTDTSASVEEVARNLLVFTARVRRRRSADDDVDHARSCLRRMPAQVVQHEAEVLVLELVRTWWASGWQPAELHRQGRRRCSSAAGAALIALAIAVDHLGRPATSLDDRWRAQVEALHPPVVAGGSGWLGRWLDEQRLDAAEAVDVLLDVLGNLLDLQPVDVLLPPPGTSDDGKGRPWSPSSEGAEIDPVLQRIRNLLAKAESTTFEAEAMAFTAKAQELMTRHAIDAAALRSSGGPGGGVEPVLVRIPIDAPYVDAKSLLLQVIAEAGRCRAVCLTSLGLSAVVGLPDDLAAVEALFTSLLVQAQTALAAASERAPAGTRVRSRAYRSSFLWSYAMRIGDRLREVNEAIFAEAEADGGEAFLPVLASQAAEVDALVETRFGELSSMRSTSGHDAAGWAGGRVAADNAELGFGRLVG